MIEFNQVTKTYPDGTEALKNFSLKVEKGEIVTLIGPSGCGKTTSLKMINRLIEPTSGTIYINDKPINNLNMHELRWNIGYVLQQIALFPHMTIEENVSVVPEMKKWKRNQIRGRTDELLHMVGLEPDQYRKRMPRELSGGQQQRIGVIRALAADPDIILMDEPFSALDPISREQLQKDIQKLQKEIQKTIVFVTHDMDEALALGDKVCLMKDGEAVQIDTPQQLILQPKNSFVKDFIGERKSPWQTMVDIIADRSGTHLISEADYDKGNIPESGFYVVAGDEQTFAGAVNHGHPVAAATLDNNLTLYKATEIIEASDQHVFPVVKGTKLIGTITYKDIVEFLKENTKMENGVITHE